MVPPTPPLFNNLVLTPPPSPLLPLCHCGVKSVKVGLGGSRRLPVAIHSGLRTGLSIEMRRYEPRSPLRKLRYSLSASRGLRPMSLSPLVPSPDVKVLISLARVGPVVWEFGTLVMVGCWLTHPTTAKGSQVTSVTWPWPSVTITPSNCLGVGAWDAWYLSAYSLRVQCCQSFSHRQA